MLKSCRLLNRRYFRYSAQWRDQTHWTLITMFKRRSVDVCPPPLLLVRSGHVLKLTLTENTADAVIRYAELTFQVLAFQIADFREVVVVQSSFVWIIQRKVTTHPAQKQRIFHAGREIKIELSRSRKWRYFSTGLNVSSSLASGRSLN